MKRSIIEIYAMAVCFATALILVITIGAACYNLVQMTYPEFTVCSYTFTSHQSNDAFWRHLCYYNSYYGVNKDVRPPEAELTQKRLEDYKISMKDESRNGMQKLLKALFIIFIGLAFFSIHWRIARRARETNNTGNMV